MKRIKKIQGIYYNNRQFIRSPTFIILIYSFEEKYKQKAAKGTLHRCALRILCAMCYTHKGYISEAKYYVPYHTNSLKPYVIEILLQFYCISILPFGLFGPSTYVIVMGFEF